MSEEIMHSLELAAGKSDDLSPDVYSRYFARCAGSEALMSHVDNLVRGKMLNEVMRLMMEPTLDTESTYLDFEVDNHRRAYFVEPHMYESLFTAFRDSVRDLLDDSWTEPMEVAWQRRIDDLLSEITSRYPASA